MVVEERVRPLEVNFVQIQSWSDTEIELVTIRRAKVERHTLLRWRRFCKGPEKHIEPEVCRQHECSTVIGVVGHEQVRHGSLWRGGLQRGVRINDARGSVKPGIRNSPDSHLAVVIGHVLQQKLNRVIGVGAVVHILARFLDVHVRMHFHKFAFGEISSSYILIDEDVIGLFKLFGWSQVFLVLVFAIGTNAVGRAIHENRMRLRSVLGHISGGEQFLAVAHRDAVLVLGVMRLDVVFLRLRRVLRFCRAGSRQRAQCEHQKNPTAHHDSLHAKSPFRALRDASRRRIGPAPVFREERESVQQNGPGVPAPTPSPPMFFVRV